jgi:hypothetical protein
MSSGALQMNNGVFLWLAKNSKLLIQVSFWHLNLKGHLRKRQKAGNMSMEEVYPEEPGDTGEGKMEESLL